LREIELLEKKTQEILKQDDSITSVVLTGDLSNDFAKMHMQSFNAIISLLKTITQYVDLYYIVGNHDAINNRIFLTDDHFFNAFKEWKRVTVVDKPMRLDLLSGFIVLCPYVPPGRLEEALDTLKEPWRDATAIFCHQEFHGANMGAITSNEGDIWPLEAPLAISGHIHEYQRLQPNILYVGTPYYTSFGDSQRKTISLFDFSKSPLTEKRIELGLPKKITQTIAVAEFKQYEVPENAHVRLYVSGTTEEIEKLKKTKRYQEFAQKIKIIPKPTNTVTVQRNTQNKGYIDLLSDAVKKETPTVRKLFKEVVQDADNT